MIKKLKKEQMLIGVLMGILLLIIAIPLPEKRESSGEKEILEEAGGDSRTDTVEARLKEVLGKISGVGEVEVFITYKDQGTLIVEKDETVSEELIKEADSSGGTRTTTTVQNEKQTVYGEGERPYVIQEIAPEVEGILVVAQGAGKESVKKQIGDTIEALFGLESHKISIMKMEVSK